MRTSSIFQDAAGLSLIECEQCCLRAELLKLMEAHGMGVPTHLLCQKQLTIHFKYSMHSRPNLTVHATALAGYVGSRSA